MLSRKEHRLNLYCLYLLGKMNVLPIHTDPKNFIFEPTSSWNRMVIWIIVALAIQFHVFYALGRFLISLREKGFSVISTATVDYAVIMYGELGLHAMLESFFRNPAVTKLLCKNLVREESYTMRNSRRGVFWGYSFSELCTMVFPVGVFPAVPIVTFMYGRIYLWTETSGCGTRKCVLSFLTELAVNFLWMSFCYCIGLLQIVFLQKLSHDIQVATEQLR